MKYKFDIDKIVNYLEKHKSNLSTLYTWKVNFEKLVDFDAITQEQLTILEDLNIYEKGIELKRIVGKKLNESRSENPELFDALSLWIIKDWGGISSAKDIDTKELIKDFFNDTFPSFNRIASASKVRAFLEPEKYAIYDSRVIFSLNWILLSENASEFFFPSPEGRNSKMSAMDLNVLIRLKNIHHYKTKSLNELCDKLFIHKSDKKIYIPKNNAYSEFNKLMKKVNCELWKDDNEKKEKLYYTEMLLFSIADREIFMDITQKSTLTFDM